MFLGMPSPSLARIQKMNMADLAARIERLTNEVANVEEKVKRLQQVDPRPDAKITELGALIKRLAALRNAAKDQLEMKVERKRRWDEKHGGQNQS
ncbi:MAG: hypothetical protein CMJ49_10565 [Planctomycetaceae bacterium]|nr:hypothetical protein [Planctomycetaceae bacterium]